MLVQRDHPLEGLGAAQTVTSGPSWITIAGLGNENVVENGTK